MLFSERGIYVPLNGKAISVVLTLKSSCYPSPAPAQFEHTMMVDVIPHEEVDHQNCDKIKRQKKET